MPNRKYKRKKKKKPLTRDEIVRITVVSMLVLALGFTLGLFCLCSYKYTGTIIPTAELFDGQPTIRFIDVGQGDCTLITYKGDSVMIDCGTSSDGGTAAKNAMIYSPELDYLVITHPHEDHMGGAAEVLTTVNVSNLVISDISAADEFYTKALEAAEESGTNIIIPTDAYSFSAGEIGVEILDSFGFEYTDVNDASLVCRVTVGETTLLITGDAEDGEERFLMSSSASLLNCDILKVGHHGSRFSTSTDFLEAVSPEVCVISVGRGNSYGHPTKDVLDRIGDYGADIRRTDLEGTITIRGKAEDSRGLAGVWRELFGK